MRRTRAARCSEPSASLIWGWADSISLRVGDLDHLVVTRRGQLVSLDLKWRSSLEASDTLDVARAARKVRPRAEVLTRTLLKGDRGARHRARTKPLSVRPVVVLRSSALVTSDS